MAGARTPITTRSELNFRAALLEDAGFVADLDTALFPDEPEDPVLLRFAWENEDPEWVQERLIILQDGRPVGFAFHSHPPWEKVTRRFGSVGADLLPQLRSAAGLSRAFDTIEERSRRSGAETFETNARESDTSLRHFLQARGYREDRLGKWWELDLVGQRDRLLTMREAARARMRDQGISLLTLDQDEDPERYQQLNVLGNETGDDVPSTLPNVHTPFEVFFKWLHAPSLREDRIWIARTAGAMAGSSFLMYPPQRGNVWTEFTGVARAARGRGIARALKLETLGQAIELGVPRVRTENDRENAPILHINEHLGYVSIPGLLSFLKPA